MRFANWEKAAKYCEDTYGIWVDWKEGFFHCPECDEPIYMCDWDPESTADWSLCPICEFNFYD